MKIVFLDFDGVLNTGPFLREAFNSGKMGGSRDWIEMIDPIKVKLLNQIVEKTGCKFVVSSSWRIANSIEDLQDFLNHHGFIGELIDRTPSKLSLHQRGGEIKLWLHDNKDLSVEKFVILDDDSDMLDLKSHLVQTHFDPQAAKLVGFEGGLQQSHVDEIVERLNS